MCGKACQIPATMARDLPQPHTVYVSVCGWVSKRDGGCLLAVNMTTMRNLAALKRHKMAKRTVSINGGGASIFHSKSFVFTTPETCCGRTGKGSKLSKLSWLFKVFEEKESGLHSLGEFIVHQ